MFGNGTVAPWTTLMAIAHCASTHAPGYESSYELAVHLGIGKHAAQHIADVIRSIQAKEAKEEQDDFKWLDGATVEADETSARVERKNCPKGCDNASCKNNELGRCKGYRLLHRRFICICPRGERHLAMFFELPERTARPPPAGSL